MSETRPKLATLTEAYKYLNISRTHLYQLTRAGALPVVYVGKAPRIEWEAIDKYIEDRRTKVTA